MSLIHVGNLGKAFRSYRSEWLRFARWFGISVTASEESWVLRHVNFDVRAGEAIGIIGQNGAGKSTLLKMITGTVEPAEGKVVVNGSIAAILELGMGFNPELSGRQNIFHSAGLMGFSVEEIRQAMPKIEEFAEIGSYFDEPVRIYSSGMQMRIAFSVATGFKSEVLIVDEALAVGDAHFQRKCFQRIEEFRREGGTLFFVSHDPGMIKTLCTRALLLDKGRLIKDGTPKEVMDLYQGLISQTNDFSESKLSVQQGNSGERVRFNTTTKTENGDAELLEFSLFDEDRKNIVYIESEKKLTVCYRVKLNKVFERPAFGLIVRNKYGHSIFETSTYAMNMSQSPRERGEIIDVTFSILFNLKAGQYFFSVGVANKGFSRSEFEELSLLMHDVDKIQVIESPSSIFYGGIYNMKPEVIVEKVLEGVTEV